MTEEQKHILEYLKQILPTIWDNLDDYAKENALTNLPYNNVEELLADIENDAEDDYYLIEWYFLEALRNRNDIGNLLDELLVYEDDECCIYEINDKYIKIGDTTAEYQFVSKEEVFPSETIEYLKTIIEQLKKENELLKQKLYKTE